MSRGPHIKVAGAGVLGLAVALRLADAGARVTVFDLGGANASSVAAGMLAPVFEAVLDEGARPHFDLMLAARDLWPGFAQRADIALDRTGAMAAGEAGWLAGVEARISALGVPVARIEGAGINLLSPGLAAETAVLCREDWRVDAPPALARLRAACAEAGVAVVTGPADATGRADAWVVATGASRTLEGLAPSLSMLRPIRGQLVRVPAPAAGAVVRGEGVYATPGAEMVFGATMETGVDDATADPAAAAPLRAAGLRLFPGLADRDWRAEAGVRAATPDGLPLVGPDGPGVFAAAGARRNGWLLAPLVADVIRAYVMGRDPGPFAARLDPGRFREGA
jgi:glycine oxidase